MLSSPTRRTVALTLLLAVLLGGTGAAVWASYQTSAYPGGIPTRVTIPEGASGRTIAEQLETSDVIRNAFAFRLVARSQGVADTVQAGTYQLATGLSADEALALLAAGPITPESPAVTIERGSTMTALLAQLDVQTSHPAGTHQQALTTPPDPENPLTPPYWWPQPAELPHGTLQVYEGLFPAGTHQLRPDNTPHANLQQLAGVTGTRVAALDRQALQTRAAAGQRHYDLIILASLLDQHVTPNQQRQIAEVLHHQLAAGQPLATTGHNHPTVGLPPTPVGAVSEEALAAATNPTDHGFTHTKPHPTCPQHWLLATDADDLTRRHTTPPPCPDATLRHPGTVLPR